jgi:hypothetical protein
VAGPRPPVPDDLTIDEKRRLYTWATIRALVPRLRELVDDCLSHHGATGNRRRYTDWYRACQNWISGQPAKERERRERWREEELPQEPGPRLSDRSGADFVPLGDLGELFNLGRRHDA